MTDNEETKSIDDHIEDVLQRGSIEFPIQVDSVDFEESEPIGSWRKDVGSLVSIRPCAKEYDNKTFLGIYIGDIPLSLGCSYDKENRKLTAGFRFHNPAIFVPELKKVIFGMESWWGVIESEEELKEITDKTIANIPYIKILKEMDKKNREQEDSKT